MSRRREVGHALAKLLGIQLEEPEFDNPVTRGESVFSNHTADGFVEQQPSSAEWLDELIPSARDVVDYVKSLFPFLSWIGFYNLQWLLGDLVAGVTVGAVVIPQGMAYAKLAALPVEFGLYSSFMGVLCYWFFATSKDITIGPVAVMSTLVGSIVTRAVATNPEAYADQPWVVASALSIICGCIVLFIGLIRCGWIVELMPLVSLASFMTGSAINIASGQVSTMLGIKGVNTREATYMVIINTLKSLPTTTMDASVGLTALVMLYIIRYVCTAYAKKFPSRSKLFFFLSTLRTAFIILLYTLISWLVNRQRATPAWKLLGAVPTGFQHAAVPTVNKDIISLFITDLPAAVIVLLIEHIAISKSFGRVNNYTINPSQEMVAIGVTNILGPFLGGYPATGSFSRTAIKSKAGVRTPFAGVITAAVVLIAIYCLGGMFYWIPQAALAGVIIHAVGDLVTPPQTLYKFWRVSPLEVFIFFIGVFVIIFTSIENGIYTTMILSFCVYMYRVLRSKGDFLGKVKVHSVLGDHVIGNDNNVVGSYGTMKPQSSDSVDSGSMAARNLFLPIGNPDGSNPELEIASPYPGIFIYRFQESFNYPSATSTLTFLSNYIFAHTRRTAINTYSRPGDRPWNDPGPKKGQEEDTSLPTLKAIILDFSSVSNVDVTSVQHLIDIRNQMDRYTQPDYVDWHMACINSRWTKRALVSAGFGYPTERADGKHVEWRSIFSIAEIGGDSSAAAAARGHDNGEKSIARRSIEQASYGAPVAPSKFADSEMAAASEASSVVENDAVGSTGFSQLRPGDSTAAASSSSGTFNGAAVVRKRVVVHGLNRPLFHTDLTSALQSAIANVAARTELEAQGGTDIGVTA